jgi:hypothetical protein
MLPGLFVFSSAQSPLQPHYFPTHSLRYTYSPLQLIGSQAKVADDINDSCCGVSGSPKLRFTSFIAIKEFQSYCAEIVQKIHPGSNNAACEQPDSA